MSPRGAALLLRRPARTAKSAGLAWLVLWSAFSALQASASPDHVGLEHIIPSTPLAILERSSGRSYASKIDQYTPWHGGRREQFYNKEVGGADSRTTYGIPGGVANGNDYNLVGENVGEVVQDHYFERNAFNLSQARNRLAVTTLGPLVIFGGGNAGRNGAQEELASSRVDILTIQHDNMGQLNTLESGEFLSESREDLVAVSTNGQALFAGGQSTNAKLHRYSSVVDIYDLASGLWSQSSLAQPRAALAATTLGNYAFFAGGVTGTEAETYYSDFVDIYNKDKNPKEEIAKLSQQRGHLAAASVNNTFCGTGCNGYVIFAGGFSRSRYTELDPVAFSDRVDIYDPTTKVFTRASLSLGRGMLAGASVGSKVIFAGGISNDGPSDRIDIWDSLTNTWSIAALSQKRWGLVGVTMDCPARRLAVFSGGLATGGFSRWHLEGQR